jgi:ATP-dependent Clp protease protease subunit
MDANKAVELGFADDILRRAEDVPEDTASPAEALLFSRKAVNAALVNKLEAKYHIPKREPEAPEEPGRSVDDILQRLDTISKFM